MRFDATRILEFFVGTILLVMISIEVGYRASPLGGREGVAGLRD
jgi:hypothetical protein